MLYFFHVIIKVCVVLLGANLSLTPNGLFSKSDVGIDHIKVERIPIDINLFEKENSVIKNYQDEVKVQKRKRKRVAFYLQDGVEVLDFAGPMEVFDYAGFDVFTVSKSTKPIISQGILTILPDYDLKSAPKADILAFFGGNSGNASDDREVIQWVKDQNKVDFYFSVCTGVFVLAEAGLLNGKHATTFHQALDRLENEFKDVKIHRNARYVDNGQIITTAGISAGIDGALHLVARIQGAKKAHAIADKMEYDKWIPGDGLQLAGPNPYLK